MSRIRILVLIAAMVIAGVVIGHASLGAEPRAALAATGAQEPVDLSPSSAPIITATNSGEPAGKLLPLGGGGSGDPNCTGCLYKVYAAPRFAPARSDLTYKMAGSAIQPTAVFTDGAFIAPLDLPNGASIQLIRFYFKDSSATKDLQFRLLGYDFSGMTPGYFGVTYNQSSGASNYWQYLSVTEGLGITINTTINDYALAFYPSEANGPHEIGGAVVGYRVMAAALPIIMR